MLYRQGVIGVGVPDEAVDPVDEAGGRAVFPLLSRRIMTGKRDCGVGVDCPGRRGPRPRENNQGGDGGDGGNSHAQGNTGGPEALSPCRVPNPGIRIRP
jgi:hypothetical protein